MAVSLARQPRTCVLLSKFVNLNLVALSLAWRFPFEATLLSPYKGSTARLLAA